MLSYDFNELFGFLVDLYGECSVYKYLKKNDPTITEVEIPAEHNGKPVLRIGFRTFEGAKYLKSVKVPKRVKEIERYAFSLCPELERVEFTSKPIIDLYAFTNCPKLPPETVVMGLVRSTDITRPIFKRDIPQITSNYPDDPCGFFRRDVFELLIKNDCFRECNLKRVFYGIIKYNKAELFPVAEQNGILEDAELVDALINCAARFEKVECAAYLLDLKNRKFGAADFKAASELEPDELGELYRFVVCSKKGLGGYAIAEYLKKDDPNITELELPAEYKGRPVTMICSLSFYNVKHLKCVVIPPSVRYIARFAFVDSALESVRFSDSPIKLAGFVFAGCHNLERVEFGSTPPELGPRVFDGCEKLPPELFAKSLTRFTDRVCRQDYRATIDGGKNAECDSLRPEVFEILAKNKCYKKLNLKVLFEKIIIDNRAELLPIAEQYGMLDSAELLELLISCAAERHSVEITAYLLELKRKKFGFEGGNDFEL